MVPSLSKGTEAFTLILMVSPPFRGTAGLQVYVTLQQRNGSGFNNKKGTGPFTRTHPHAIRSRQLSQSGVVNLLG